MHESPFNAYLLINFMTFPGEGVNSGAFPKLLSGFFYRAGLFLGLVSSERPQTWPKTGLSRLFWEFTKKTRGDLKG